MKPSPRVAATSSAATSVVQPAPSAMRKPVMIEGRALGSTTWRMTSLREAPNERAAFRRSCCTPRTPDAVDKAIGATNASAMSINMWTLAAGDQPENYEVSLVMANRTVVGFSGNFTRPSKTRGFVEHVVTETAGRYGLAASTYDVVDLVRAWAAQNGRGSWMRRRGTFLTA